MIILKECKCSSVICLAFSFLPFAIVRTENQAGSIFHPKLSTAGAQNPSTPTPDLHRSEKKYSPRFSRPSRRMARQVLGRASTFSPLSRAELCWSHCMARVPRSARPWGHSLWGRQVPNNRVLHLDIWLECLCCVRNKKGRISPGRYSRRCTAA